MLSQSIFILGIPAFFINNFQNGLLACCNTACDVVSTVATKRSITKLCITYVVYVQVHTQIVSVTLSSQHSAHHNKL